MNMIFRVLLLALALAGLASAGDECFYLGDREPTSHLCFCDLSDYVLNDYLDDRGGVEIRSPDGNGKIYSASECQECFCNNDYFVARGDGPTYVDCDDIGMGDDRGEDPVAQDCCECCGHCGAACNTVFPLTADLTSGSADTFSWALCEPCPTVTLDDFSVTNGFVEPGSVSQSGCNVNARVAPSNARRSPAAPNAGSVCLLGVCATFLTSGVGAGDPHLLGINGQRFDFHGEIGGVYNLLSAPQLSVNTLIGPFSTVQDFEDAGTWMVRMCITVGGELAGTDEDVTVTVNAGGGEYAAHSSMEINGEEVAFNEDGEHTLGASDGVSIRWRVVEEDATLFGAVWSGRAVRVLDIWVRNHLSARVLAMEDGRAHGKWVALPHRYLDITLAPLRAGLPMEGILGRTSALEAEADATLGEREEEYRIESNDLCDVQYRHSLF